MNDHAATLPTGGGARTTRRQNAENGFKASKQLTDNLQEVLVDLTELHLQSKQAHWNLVGKNFRDLHRQLDEIIEEARAFSDTIAERLRALHAMPDGRSDTVAATTTLPEFPNGEVETSKAVDLITERLDAKTPAIISVFAGRIADTGVDPLPIMKASVEAMKAKPKAELIWASPRELLNVFQADAVGCHIITATNDILKKLSLVGKDLDRYSLETVEMFYKDAKAAGYTIAPRAAA